MDRVKTIEEMLPIVADIRSSSSGNTIVTTNGTFDILHSAHIHILEEAKKYGQTLIVLLNSDESTKLNKNPKRPIIPELERARTLAGLRSVDYVVIFPDKAPLDYIQRIQPDVHVKGGTYIEDKVAKERELVESWGGRCIYLGELPGISSTNVIDTVLERYGKKE